MKAEHLLDAIGQLDDGCVQRAVYYRRSRRSLKKWLALAAAFIIVAYVAISNFTGNKDNLGSRDVLEQTLISVKDYLTPQSQINLFDGTTKLIWSYGDGDYYALTVSLHYDAQGLINSVASNQYGSGKPEQNSIRLWVSFGNGLVVSPYIEFTPGNIGYGEIFNYEPERAVSRDFAEYLSSIIRKYSGT